MNQILLPDQSILEYIDQGTGHALLFIHAPCIGHVNFQYQAPLAQDFRLIIPDLPGHGGSSPIKGKLCTESLAQLIDYLVEQLELDQFTLCGYSQGASLALEYLLRYPHKVSSAILVSGYSEVNTLFLHTRYLTAQALSQMGAVGVLARTISSSHLSDEHEQQKWIEHMRRTDPHTLHELYVTGHHYNCSQQLHQIKTPVLLIYGGNDEPMHTYAKQLHQGLNHSFLHFIPDISHQVVTKGAEQLHELLRPFVQSHAISNAKSPVFV
ncbi:alpha/beta fold hydrolase [Brevibacillus ginsengisoli]|uniref:alpha/beta fold hydrolase n=1 Tax=Brevibacillus ginsengisoli TaxID=363854 RepID=UPI003CEEB78B